MTFRLLLLAYFLAFGFWQFGWITLLSLFLDNHHPLLPWTPVWLLHTLSTTILRLVPLIVCSLWGLSLWHGLNYLYSCPYTPSTRPSLCIIGEGGDREQDPCPASLDFCQLYIDL